MRRIFENDVKNRVTNVTEYSLNRDGVKKSTYATQFSNTNLVELDSSVEESLNSVLGESVNSIANTMRSNNFASEFAPKLCDATEVLGDITIMSSTFIEYVRLNIYNEYSIGTVFTIYIDSDTEGETLASITIGDSITPEYSVGVDRVIDATVDNPVTIKVSISGNTNENARGIISYKYHAVS